MSFASWDEGRAVPLTRHQVTAAASDPAALSRPSAPDGPMHGIGSSVPIRNNNEYAPLVADILGLAPPEVCDPFLVMPAGDDAALDVVEVDLTEPAIPFGVLAFAARSQRPVRYAMRREVGS